ncbi:DUF2130 domain-containing protein [Ferruginibacter albus]|uniref:DUF2130 domain-containing protein n=1 Tax=Ferruginibacter albus TaxID=2875540 RepID=UPI001CC482EC|nr:DUF2130 domain-containing protein [Ferruginibacter albus]UAY51337.1 DUF2130 domain-containing protein [Ferruginibacter albus]
MANEIKCPHCGNVFDVEDVLAADIEKKYQQKYQDELKQSLNKVEADKKKLETEQVQFEEKKKRENEIFAQKLQQEKQKMELELQEQLKSKIAADYEGKLKLVEENNRQNEEKLKAARQKEIEFLQKEQQMKNKEAELEITLQKKLQEERTNITEQIRKQETEKNLLKENEFQLKLREMEKQLDDQKKLAEEMKRRAEQGSMQLQGEVQEIILEELLKTNFPFDEITEVGKGVRGADCIQHIRNNTGQACGKIIFESKRTKDFALDWVEKLKVDMRNSSADIAVIVTQAMPKDMERFGEKNGVYICTFTEVIALVNVLRNSIIRFYAATKSQENKGEKMNMLYSYLTSHEFAEQWNAIREGFMSMKLSIQKERDAMEKLWKAREKQLEKVLLNAAHIRGSVEGIAGSDSVDLNLLDSTETNLLDS